MGSLGSVASELLENLSLPGISEQKLKDNIHMY